MPPPCRGRCWSSSSWSSSSDLGRSGAAGGPWRRREGESRKRGSAEDGNVSEAPVGSILSQRMRGGRQELRRSGSARKGPSRTAGPASRRDGAELRHIPACPRMFSCIGCKGQPPAASSARGARGAAAQGWYSSRQPLALLKPSCSFPALCLSKPSRDPNISWGEAGGPLCAPKVDGGGCPRPEGGGAGGCLLPNLHVSLMNCSCQSRVSRQNSS